MVSFAMSDDPALWETTFFQSKRAARLSLRVVAKHEAACGAGSVYKVVLKNDIAGSVNIVLWPADKVFGWLKRNRVANMPKCFTAFFN